jgi:hypothetical protein
MKYFTLFISLLFSLTLASQRTAIDSHKLAPKAPLLFKGDSSYIIYPGAWQEATDFILYETQSGYVNGTNEFDDLAKAQQFNISEPVKLQGAFFWIRAISGTSGKVNFNLWSFDGEPTEILTSKSIPVADLVQSVDIDEPFYVAFDEIIELSDDFAIGIELSDMNGSQIGLVSSLDGQGSGMDLVWEQWFDLRWYSYLGFNSWNYDIDLGVFPLACVDAVPTEQYFAGGDGTAENPYQIMNYEQLDSVRYFPDKAFIQMADIDLASMSGSWHPIGNIQQPFSGSYDGDGFLINNLTIDVRPDWTIRAYLAYVSHAP